MKYIAATLNMTWRDNPTEQDYDRRWRMACHQIYEPTTTSQIGGYDALLIYAKDIDRRTRGIKLKGCLKTPNLFLTRGPSPNQVSKIYRR